METTSKTSTLQNLSATRDEILATRSNDYRECMVIMDDSATYLQILSTRRIDGKQTGYAIGPWGRPTEGMLYAFIVTDDSHKGYKATASVRIFPAIDTGDREGVLVFAHGHDGYINAKVAKGD